MKNEEDTASQVTKLYRRLYVGAGGRGGGTGSCPHYTNVCNISLLCGAVGSLSNYDDDDDDDDDDEDFKKQYPLMIKTHRSARASCFLVHFFDVHRTTTT